MTHRTYAIAVGALWVEQYWTHDRSCTLIPAVAKRKHYLTVEDADRVRASLARAELPARLIAIDITETDLEPDPAEAQAGREANR